MIDEPGAERKSIEEVGLLNKDTKKKAAEQPHKNSPTR